MTEKHFYDLKTGRLIGSAEGFGDSYVSEFLAINSDIGVIDVPPGTDAEQWIVDLQAGEPQLVAWVQQDKVPRLRDRAKRRIDQQAESMRLSWLSPGDGQMMAYLAKENEARALMQAPDMPAGPMIAAEATAIGISPLDLAETICSQADAWHAASAEIEALRRKAKLAIDAAGDEQAIDAALQEGTAALHALTP